MNLIKCNVCKLCYCIFFFKTKTVYIAITHIIYAFSTLLGFSCSSLLRSYFQLQNFGYCYKKEGTYISIRMYGIFFIQWVGLVSSCN